MRFPFGEWSIEPEAFCWIFSTLRLGDTIVEFGSGECSAELNKIFKVYSLEHHEFWNGKYATNYIYAPIVNGWYDREILKRELPDKYDLILIDGPDASQRTGLMRNLDLFNWNVPVVIDDTQEDYIDTMATELGKHVGRDVIRLEGRKKKFAVIPC